MQARLAGSGWDGAASEHGPPARDGAPTITLTAAASRQRVGMEVRLLVAGRSDRRAPDRSLLRLLGQAYRYQRMILRGDGASIAELAAEAGVSDTWFSRLVRLSFLAPEIVQAILHNRHPLALNAQRLLHGGTLPIAWADQRTHLGLH